MNSDQRRDAAANHYLLQKPYWRPDVDTHSDTDFKAGWDACRADPMYLALSAREKMAKLEEENARMKVALEHYESAHYDHQGKPCYQDKTASEALEGK